jgi:3-oxoacid CoA-transferase B subunit
MALAVRQEGRRRIALQAASELPDGSVINLGIGLPTMVLEHLDPARGILVQSENGLVGMGPPPRPGAEDPHVINAGGMPVTVRPGAAYTDTATAFGIIRGGYIDVAILGALEVSAAGDLANWVVPGRSVPGVGGAVELATCARRVVAVCEHVSRDGESKIRRECTLPLTAAGVVDRIVTDLAAFDVTPTGLVLTHVAPDVSADAVAAHTDASFALADRVLELPSGRS